MWTTPKGLETFVPHLEAGFRKAGAGKGFGNFEIAVTINVVVNKDVQAARDALKPGIALYVGGMGARGRNFYTDHVSRQGWEGDARKIQDLFLGGKRHEATAAVPDALVDELALVGPKELIRERASAWKASKATTLLITGDTNAIEVMAEAFL